MTLQGAVNGIIWQVIGNISVACNNFTPSVYSSDENIMLNGKILPHPFTIVTG